MELRENLRASSSARSYRWPARSSAICLPVTVHRQGQQDFALSMHHPMGPRNNKGTRIILHTQLRWHFCQCRRRCCPITCMVPIIRVRVREITNTCMCVLRAYAYILGGSRARSMLGHVTRGESILAALWRVCAGCGVRCGSHGCGDITVAHQWETHGQASVNMSAREKMSYQLNGIYCQ